MKTWPHFGHLGSATAESVANLCCTVRSPYPTCISILYGCLPKLMLWLEISQDFLKPNVPAGKLSRK